MGALPHAPKKISPNPQFLETHLPVLFRLPLRCLSTLREGHCRPRHIQAPPLSSVDPLLFSPLCATSLDFPEDLPETMVVCGFPGASARFDKGWILLGVLDLSCENRFELRFGSDLRPRSAGTFDASPSLSRHLRLVQSVPPRFDSRSVLSFSSQI